MIAHKALKRGGILAALRRSPLVGADLNLTRSRQKSRRIWWKIIAIAVVAALIAYGTRSIYLFMSGIAACNTIVRSLTPAPDGKKSLVIFQKECGATVGFNTQASIAPTGEDFSTETSPAFLVVSGERVIVARWADDNTVEISSIPGKDRAFKNDQRVGNVKVLYK